MTTSPPVTTPPRHQDNRLASTGADVGWLLVLGVLLGIAGVLLLLIDRRRLFRR
ncbi:LPXTG cell wall anchor domain-containing protein [Lentzea sp. NPDC004782]|uniref:LPXTG cell wall anchor domain-containing protein n=1 Tax=Lentzea sp. NPDC004782 TaxID=3154458 RepID=UPI0033B848FB